MDHLALKHIIKSKAQPATTRIKRLLELISSYSFNLCYMKGKDMILCDFLSRQTHDTGNLYEIIPISFNMYNTLYETYYRIEAMDKYLVQIHSQTKAVGVSLPEVHGAKKIIVTNMPIKIQKTQIQVRGRAGM